MPAPVSVLKAASICPRLCSPQSPPRGVYGGTLAPLAQYCARRFDHASISSRSTLMRLRICRRSVSGLVSPRATHRDVAALLAGQLYPLPGQPRHQVPGAARAQPAIFPRWSQRAERKCRGISMLRSITRTSNGSDLTFLPAAGRATGPGSAGAGHISVLRCTDVAGEYRLAGQQLLGVL